MNLSRSKFWRTVIMLGGLAPGAAMAADYSGSWVRDPAKSNFAPYPNYWLTRSLPAAGPNNAPFVLQIRQSPDSVQLTDPVHPQRTYMLDGKTHMMPTDSLRAQVAVNASMRGDRMTVTTSQPYGGMPGNVTLKATELWSLSPDGKILTIETARDLPGPRQMFKEIYSRQ